MYVACELRVSGIAPGDEQATQHQTRHPGLTFGSVVFRDSQRSIIESLGVGRPPLIAGLEIVSLLVGRYGGEVTEVDVRSGHDVRFTLRFPLHESVAAETQDDHVSDM